MKSSVLVAFDISGSISRELIKKNAAEVISKICPNAEIHVGTFDHQWHPSTINDVLTGNVPAGGGTFMTPVFNEADNYDHCIIVTDGYIDPNEMDIINNNDNFSLHIYA